MCKARFQELYDFNTDKSSGGGPLITPDLNGPTEAGGKLSNLLKVTQLTGGGSTV